MLRLTGDLVADEALGSFDQKQQDSLGNSLGGEVGELAWEQARRRMAEGGLGVKTGKEVALPAVVASLTTARPAAFEWFRRIRDKGIMSMGELCEVYDAMTERAQHRLEGRTYSEEVVGDWRELVCRGAEAAEEA